MKIEKHNLQHNSPTKKLRSSIRRANRSLQNEAKQHRRAPTIVPRERFDSMIPHANLVLGGKNAFPRLYRPYQRDYEGRVIVSALGRTVTSVDADFRKLCHAVADDFSADYPPVAAHGFLQSGAPQNFSAVLSVAGVKMTPSNVPLLDNVVLLREKGLACRPSPELVAIADAVLALVHKRRATQPMRLSRVSSSTINTWTTAMPVKQGLVRSCLANLGEILTLLRKRDFVGLASRYSLFFVYLLGERMQPDGCKRSDDGRWIPKERLVALPDGRVVAADKTSMLSARGIDGYAMRVRTVYALAGATAYLLTALRSLYSGYLEEYAFTWKSHGSEDRERRVEGAFSLMSFDATQMDQHVPKWFLEMHTTSLCSRILGEQWLPFMRAIDGAGYLAPPTSADSSDLLYAGSLFGPFDVTVGLASGRSDNPDIGKLFMTSIYLEMFYRGYNEATQGTLADFFVWLSGTPDPKDAIDKYLRGEARIKAMNAGDDQLSWVLDEKDTLCFEGCKRVQEAKGSMSEYLDIKVEDVTQFLGDVAYRSADDPKAKVSFLPSPNSAIVKFLAPERSMGAAGREFGAYGRLLAQDMYRRNPVAAAALDKLDEYWSKYMPTAPRLQAMLKAASEASSPGVGELRDVDIMALADPSVIHYKVDLNELSPDVRDLLISSIAADEIDAALENFIL